MAQRSGARNAIGDIIELRQFLVLEDYLATQLVWRRKVLLVSVTGL